MNQRFTITFATSGTFTLYVYIYIPNIYIYIYINIYIYLSTDWARNGGNFHPSHSATQPLSHSSSHSALSLRVAEWLSGCVRHSGRVAEWLRQPLWQSGWVAAAESSINEMDKVFKHFNIQARLYIYIYIYYMILTATWFTNITL